jgi:hypothetical protein
MWVRAGSPRSTELLASTPPTVLTILALPSGSASPLISKAASPGLPEPSTPGAGSRGPSIHPRPPSRYRRGSAVTLYRLPPRLEPQQSQPLH